MQAFKISTYKSRETWQEQAAAAFVWVLFKLLLNVKANSYQSSGFHCDLGL